jgi:hypothetical protein
MDYSRPEYILREQQEYEEKRKRRAKEGVLRKHGIELRRQTVFNLSSRRLNQYEIARILRVSQSLICFDMANLRAQFHQALKHHIEQELPLIYNQSMQGISQIIQHAYAIYDTPGISEQIKLHALSLITDCHERRLDMATSGSIIEEDISYVEHMKSHLNDLVKEIPQDKVLEMLHDDDNIDNNSAVVEGKTLMEDDESNFRKSKSSDGSNGIADASTNAAAAANGSNGNSDLAAAVAAREVAPTSLEETQNDETCFSLADSHNNDNSSQASVNDDDIIIEEENVDDTNSNEDATTNTVF